MNEIEHVTCSEWNRAHSRCSINASCYCFMGGRVLVPKLGDRWGKGGKKGPGKGKRTFGKKTLLAMPRPAVLPGTRPHRRPKSGLPGVSCSCPVLSLLSSDDTCSGSLSCRHLPGWIRGTERGELLGASRTTCFYGQCPWEARQRTHAGSNQC